MWQNIATIFVVLDRRIFISSFNRRTGAKARATNEEKSLQERRKPNLVLYEFEDVEATAKQADLSSSLISKLFFPGFPGFQISSASCPPLDGLAVASVH